MRNSSDIGNQTRHLLALCLNQLRHRVTPAVGASRIPLDTLSRQYRGRSRVSNLTRKA